MKFICRVVCWFFLLAPFAYAAGLGSSANDFTRNLKGKVVFLRGMESGDELNFDAQGVLIGSDIPGSFCNSGVRVTNVHLSDTELKIKGERVTLVFFSKLQSPSLNDLRIIPLPEPVEITIRVDASHPELMNAAIRKVLAGNPREALSGMSPDSETDALDSVGSTLPREQIPSDPPSSKAAVYKPGSGVSPPRLIHAVEPEYTDDAKRKKLQGVCVLTMVVDTAGRPTHIRVLHSLQPDMDLNAIIATSQYRFEPGVYQGKPVAVLINVNVNFRIY